MRTNSHNVSKSAGDGTRANRAQRFFFGDDVFVSYARHDSDYALALADELTKQKLACFVDLWGTPAGVELPAELVERLKKSTMLVLIGSQSAAASENVMKEVLEFKKTKRPIIPITFVEEDDFQRIRNNEIPEDLKGTLEGASWYNEIAGIARTVESKTRLKPRPPNDAVEPSVQVVNRIVNAEGFLSRSKRLRKAFWTTFASLLALLVVAGFIASVLIKRAYQEVRIAQSAEAAATENAKRAEQGREDADKARTDAEGKTAKAQGDLIVKQGELKTAAAELVVANQKTQEEQAKAEKAGREALRQGRIASSQELAASAVSSLAADPEASVLSARDAYKVWPTEQAGRALRHSLLQSHIHAVIRDRFQGNPAAAFDSNGAHAVTADDESRTYKVWKVETGEILKMWRADDKANVAGLEFSPDGNFIVIPGYDDKAYAAYLWDWKAELSADNPRPLQGDVAAALSAPSQCVVTTCSIVFTTFSSDGKYLAAASRRGVVWIWETASGRRVGKVEPGPTAINEVRFSPFKDRYVATGDDQGQVLVSDWQAQTGANNRWVLRSPGSDSSVTSIAFDNHGQYLAAAINPRGENTSARIFQTEVFDLNTLARVSRLDGHTADINDVSFSPDSNYILTASTDGTARVYNWLDTEEWDNPVILRHGSVVFYASFDRNSEYVLTAGEDSTPRLWKPSIAHKLNTINSTSVEIPAFAVLRGHTARAWARFSSDGQYVMTTSADGTARIWMGNLEQVKTTLPEQDSWIYSAIVSADGKHVVTTSREKPVRVWAVESNGRAAEAELSGDVVVKYGRASFSADGRLVIAGSNREQGEVNTQLLHVWEWTDKSRRTKPRNIEMPGGGVLNDVAVSHNPKGPTYVVTASQANGKGLTAQGEKSDLNAARVWNLSATDQSLVPVVLRHPKPVTAVALSYDLDSLYVATASEDGVRIWDRTQSDQPLHILHSNPKPYFLQTVAFSPDGLYVAVGGYDTVIVWEWKKEVGRAHPMTLRPSLGSSEKSMVVSVSFSPDSKLILTANQGGTLRLWEPRTGDDLRIIGEYPAHATGASFSRDGRYIVAPYRSTARIYECPECRGEENLLELVSSHVSLQALDNERKVPRPRAGSRR